MKRFITTLAGKTILFIICISSVCVLSASVLGIIVYTKDELYFYKTSEEDIKKDLIDDNLVRSHGLNIMWSELVDFNNITSNFDYQIKDAKNKVVTESDNFKNSNTEPYILSYTILKDKSNKISDIYFHYDGVTDTCYMGETNGGYIETYTLLLLPVEGSSEANEIDFVNSLIHTAYSLRYAVYLIALAALILMITCFVALMYASGRHPDTCELHTGPLYKVPFDLLIAICLLMVVITSNIAGSINSALEIICAIASGIIGLCMLLGLCMSAAGRIKQHTLISGTLIYLVLKLICKVLCWIWSLVKKLFSFIASLIRELPLIWKTALIVCGLSFAELIVLLACDADRNLVWLWFIEKLILIPGILFIATLLRKLQKAGSALANGDLAYHTDTNGMFWDFKQHGENLNSIAGGMAIAVDERLKSERLKTELITNVSHDIKTPLTSIINYAGLIENETCNNPKINEYSAVLVRQSDKLKRLIEDLVEASKASTGNLDVLLAPCDAAVFITQTGGEYEDRLESSQLSLITRQPEKELRIMADGRRMWRIFDNLMNNICKYSQPHTRVYLSLEELNGNAVITFKNTSREPLDMSEEELMERFTRGDSSRNTEGNGLGLSIAKSMAELQNGSLQVNIDGDLFKAILTFPLI